MQYHIQPPADQLDSIQAMVHDPIKNEGKLQARPQQLLQNVLSIYLKLKKECYSRFYLFNQLKQLQSEKYGKKFKSSLDPKKTI
ncbi:unnamed protein product [Brugia timori]|uniref:Uncharacterized protein n=1 Tax=Brugia timori TaxID=42155 RepID=A0A3P7UMQ5_9BILA|nr:unnamed protein product [Brugia timori]